MDDAQAIDKQMDIVCHDLTLFVWSGYKQNGKELHASVERLITMVSEHLNLI